MEQPANLPPQYASAAEVMKRIIAGQPITMDAQGTQQLITPEIVVSKGFNNPLNGKPGEDILQIKISDTRLTNSFVADSVSNTVSHALNAIAAVRDAAVVVAPHEYLDNLKKETAELVAAAKAAGIPGSDVDYSQASLFSADISRNQKPKYATQIIDGPGVTSIRINIPTNPENRDAAAATAKKVEDDLNRRLPEIKAQMIERIKAKGYIKSLTPQMEAQLQGHELKVITQQQANWTSVFLEIRSPEQVATRNDPSKLAGIDTEKLKNTNMLLQITDEKSRSKLAARAVMFEGERLNKPASFFLDVAGSEDIKNGLGKLMYYLSKMKPELASRAKALMDENLFKNPEQWNIPTDKQEVFKRGVHLFINPDHPTEMKAELYVPKGKADEIATAITQLTPQMAAPMTAAPIVATTSQPQEAQVLDMATLMSALSTQPVAAQAPQTPLQQEAKNIIDMASLVGSANTPTITAGGTASALQTADSFNASAAATLKDITAKIDSAGAVSASPNALAASGAGVIDVPGPGDAAGAGALATNKQGAAAAGAAVVDDLQFGAAGVQNQQGNNITATVAQDAEGNQLGCVADDMNQRVCLENTVAPAVGKVVTPDTDKTQAMNELLRALQKSQGNGLAIGA